VGMLIGYLGRTVGEAHGSPVAMTPNAFAPAIGLAITNGPRSSSLVFAQVPPVPPVVQESTAAPASAQKAASEASDVEDLEMRFLRQGRRAIGARNYEKALKLLNEHALRYPKSTHAHERDVMIGTAAAFLARGPKP
jgi:hypothetical protein